MIGRVAPSTGAGALALALAYLAPLGSAQQADPAEWERLDQVVLAEAVRVGAPSAPQDGDEVKARNEEARADIDARLGMAVDDVRAALGDEAAAAVETRLHALRDALIAERLDKFADLEEAWVNTTIANLTAGEDWAKVLDEVLDDEQRGAFEAAASGARDERLFDASLELATTLLASELRLREPQVVALRKRISKWLEEREPTRSEQLAGDLVDEILARGKVKELLMPAQSVVLTRMRTAKKPVAPGDGMPGDDISLGRGRYPEDDFTLEAAALCQFHGWDWEKVPELVRGAGMLGREARRSGNRPARFGDSALFKTLTDPNESEIWRALVKRRRALESTETADPGPQLTGKAEALIDARAALIVAHLDQRLRLSAEQRPQAFDAFKEFARREYSARVRAFGALDAELIWRQLRFIDGKDPRRGSTSRKKLCKALDGFLSEHQRHDLGLL